MNRELATECVSISGDAKKRVRMRDLEELYVGFCYRNLNLTYVRSCADIKIAKCRWALFSR